MYSSSIRMCSNVAVTSALAAMGTSIGAPPLGGASLAAASEPVEGAVSSNASWQQLVRRQRTPEARRQNINALVEKLTAEASGAALPPNVSVLTTIADSWEQALKLAALHTTIASQQSSVPPPPGAAIRVFATLIEAGKVDAAKTFLSLHSYSSAVGMPSTLRRRLSRRLCSAVVKLAAARDIHTLRHALTLLTDAAQHPATTQRSVLYLIPPAQLLLIAERTALALLTMQDASPSLSAMEKSSIVLRLANACPGGQLPPRVKQLWESSTSDSRGGAAPVSVKLIAALDRLGCAAAFASPVFLTWEQLLARPWLWLHDDVATLDRNAAGSSAALARLRQSLAQASSSTLHPHPSLEVHLRNAHSLKSALRGLEHHQLKQNPSAKLVGQQLVRALCSKTNCRAARRTAARALLRPEVANACGTNRLRVLLEVYRAALLKGIGSSTKIERAFTNIVTAARRRSDTRALQLVSVVLPRLLLTQSSTALGRPRKDGSCRPSVNGITRSIAAYRDTDKHVFAQDVLAMTLQYHHKLLPSELVFLGAAAHSAGVSFAVVKSFVQQSQLLVDEPFDDHLVLRPVLLDTIRILSSQNRSAASILMAGSLASSTAHGPQYRVCTRSRMLAVWSLLHRSAQLQSRQLQREAIRDVMDLYVSPQPIIAQRVVSSFASTIVVPVVRSGEDLSSVRNVTVEDHAMAMHLAAVVCNLTERCALAASLSAARDIALCRSMWRSTELMHAEDLVEVD